MNDIITAQNIGDGIDFLDPRKYRRYFTADNEPVYVPILEPSMKTIVEQTPVVSQCNVGERLRKSPDRCIYYTADDVANLLGVSLSQAYKVVKKLNAELKQKNVIVQAGRLPKKFFHEKYYGLDEIITEQKI